MAGLSLRNISLDAALHDATARFIESNPISQRRYETACRTLPGGNTRTVLFHPPFPVTIERGEGARLWDADGHCYLDFLGEYTAGLYGHSNPVIRQAVVEALDSGIVLGGPNRYEVELAGLICGRFPSVDLVRFCNSGTEANLMALMTARAATGRSRAMVFEGAYHGGVLTFGKKRSPINLPIPTVTAPYNDPQAAVELVERHAGDLAAIIVEPMMGAGGCIAGTPEFLQALRDAATRHGVVLIFDEVMTSRLSPGGLQSKLGIVPDMTSFGKYLGGGLTFGAFGGRADLMAHYDPRRPDAWAHAGTFNNNVLTMAAGVAGLTKLYTPEAADRLNGRGDALRRRLNEAGERAGVPVLATGVGSILGIHFQTRPIHRPADAEETPEAARALLHLEMMAKGFYFAHRGFLSLSLPLTDADHDGFVDSFEAFLAENGQVLGSPG
ncbi:aspartate aminotransferase family protein (plasmid) [Skermanella mucosa]|uniref:aspartate aminotransferase family protein n=1 Tax=Skermanella mucosa TaxID=1789672 RepID=UPI00192B911B|nr:aspartate aminotransferase family protein [Skermanella mucosa]UEM25200.1 aspartate aminotransferase family protein [Skermanella mucosa]